MVTFISLFLGLVIGAHDVEVQPSAGVVRVELLLDGVSVGRLVDEPWSAKVDFGDGLLPHRLEAVAYDALGKETDRAVQWLNLMRALAEASLNLVLDSEGRNSRVQVTWEAVKGGAPRRTRVELDGVLLEVSEISDFALPRYNPKKLHFLRVELDFSDEVVAVAEATFGGFYTDTVNTELTSIVIDIGRKRGVDLDDLAGRFTVAGEPLEPVAVEKGSAEIIVIRDLTAQRDLLDLLAGISGAQTRYVPKDFFIRYYWTKPRLSEAGERTYLLHPHSGDQSLEGVNLVPTLLVRGLQPSGGSDTQLVAGASAVAGMAAVSRNRRRALVVILGTLGADQSYFSPEVVRSYLRAVDVPLEVWTTKKGVWTALDGWGDVEEITVGWRLRAAVDDLVRQLKRQRVVWFAGRHLPQQIEVVPGAPFRRVGAGDSR